MLRRLKMRVARALAAIGLLGLAIRIRRAQRALFSAPRRIATRRRFRGAVADERPGTLEILHQDHWCRIAIDERLRAVDVMRANLQLAIGFADTAGVPYSYLPIASSFRYRIAISEGHREQVLSLILESPDPALHLWLRTDRQVWTGIPVSRRPEPSMLAAGTRMRVFQPRIDPRGVLVFGELYGCDIEFWPERQGVLVATDDNLLVPQATRAEFGAATMDLGGITVRTLPAAVGAPHFQSPRFPVDLVYTWVDGADPEWRRRKHEVTKRLEPGRLTHDSDADARFASRDELKYSLRSVSQFADFARHVYLVTDRQVPSWLDITSPRLTVVDHRDIFEDPSVLPSFNSHAIEASLHRIEGLVEHYVYMNDDFLFGRRLGPSTFFHFNGIAKFYLSNAVISAEDLSVDHAARNAAELLESRFGIRVTNKMKHAPYAQRRSVIEALEKEFPEAVAATTSHQLRSPNDVPIASSMSHYFGFFTGDAVTATIANAYVDIGAPDYAERLAMIGATRAFDVICLNDSHAPEVDVAERDAAVNRWLEDYYPVKSEFEK